MATTNHGITVPTVGGSSDSWGAENNTALTALDGRMPSLTGLKIDGTTALPFTGAQQFASGTVSAPGISFSADPDCGLYRIGANNLGLAVNGVKQIDVTTTGVAFTGTLSATAISGTTGTFTGLVLTVASATGGAGLRLPHGAAPTSPTNGDLWTTTSGLYARINGTTVGPFAASAGSALLASNNLSDVSSASTSRTNLGLGSLATLSTISTANITDAQVTLAKMANLAQARVIGRASGAGTGVPTALTEAQLSALVDLSAATMGTGSGFSGEFKIGPLYLKCGNASVTPAQSGTTGEATVTFSNAFPTGFLAGGHCPDLTGGALGSGNNYAAYIRGPTTAAMAIGLDQDGAGSPGAITCYWWAIGY